MRIALISSKYPPEYAGSGLRAHNTYRRLKARYDIQVDVMTNSVDRSGNESYELDGIHVERFGRKLNIMQRDREPWNLKLEKHLRIFGNYILQGHPTWRNISEKKYDLIHTFGDSISVQVAMYLGQRFHIPVVREICNTPTAIQPYPILPFKLHQLLPYSYPENSRLVAISPGIKDHLLAAHIPGQLIWERPNPIDETRYHFGRESRDDLRSQFTPFSSDDSVILNVAKFMPRKNQAFLVECLQYLPENFKLMLCGPFVDSGPFAKRDGKYIEEIRAKISSLQLGHRVVLEPGFLNNVDSYYKFADVFAFPSLEDALGTPMLESIACGTPVVANYLPGVTDAWIQDGQSGFVCHSAPDPKRPGFQLTPDAREFARCLERASKFSLETRMKASQNILARAASSIIDESYINLFKQLTTQ